MKRIVTFSAALLFAVVACGGSGDGGGGGGGGPVAPPSGISFTASGGASSNALVFAVGAGSDTTRIRLDLNAQSVVDLYGIGFDLVYPSDILTFTSHSDGAFMGGVQTTIQVEESAPGRLVVGKSRLGDVPGATGSGVVLTFEFTGRGVAGAGSIQFERNNAFSRTGTPIAGVSWQGGNVTVTP